MRNVIFHKGKKYFLPSPSLEWYDKLSKEIPWNNNPITYFVFRNKATFNWEFSYTWKPSIKQKTITWLIRNKYVVSTEEDCVKLDFMMI